MPSIFLCLGFMVFILAFLGITLVSAQQNLPDCVYEAFPGLNKTTSLANPMKNSEGVDFVCESCVAFMRAVEMALLDPETEDKVSWF